MKNKASNIVSCILIFLMASVLLYLEMKPELKITKIEEGVSSAVFERKEVSKSTVFVFILKPSGELIRVSGGKSMDALLRFPMEKGFPVCLRYTRSSYERSGKFVGNSYKLNSYNGGFCNV